MKSSRHNAGVRAVVLALIIIGLIGLAILWNLHGPADAASLSEVLSRMRGGASDSPPWLAIGYVALASVLAVPLGIIIVLASVVFGAWGGTVYTLVGATLGATVSYAIGRYLGYEGMRHFAGERINRISLRLAERGVLAVVVIRMLPIAPFAIVNMIAGTSHLRMRDFVLGTILGMLPGTVLIAFSVGQVQRWLWG
ncbi:MAG TPA: VTT domain-containing protein [Azonexus sp.]|nr:VTT domain-containing protein [Azonexus sp.]